MCDRCNRNKTTQSPALSGFSYLSIGRSAFDPDDGCCSDIKKRDYDICSDCAKDVDDLISNPFNR